MRKTVIITLLGGILFFMSKDSFSQSYNTALGIRFGWFNGISAKHYLNSTNSVEGILAGRYRGFTLIGLYEWNKPTPTENLNFFFGVGGHVSSYNRLHYYHPNDKYYKNGRVFTAGVDGILGMEYSFQFPLNVSLDVHPYVDFIDWNGDLFDIGLSARYYF